MPQPVQPPETPAIVQPVTDQDAVNLNQSTIEINGSELSRSLPKTESPTPTSPEPLSPESSLLKTEKRAALLGPPISVGYSLQPANTPSLARLQPQPSDRLPTSPYPTPPTSAYAAIPSQSPPPSTPSPASVSQGFSLHGSRLTPEFLLPNSSSIRLDTQNVKRLVTKERGGEVREFDFSVSQSEVQPSVDEQVTPVPNQDQTAPQPSPNSAPVTTPQPSPTPASGTTDPNNSFGVGGVIELTADRQEYDDQRKVITAQGNVVLRFRESLLNADRVQVNLPNRLIVAEGNVALTRGQQVLRGNRFEYYFVQDSGVILNASGELYSPTAGTDLSLLTPDGAPGTSRPLSDRIAIDQPLQGISNPGGYSFVIGAGRAAQNLPPPQSGGTINRFRYQAERVEFEGQNAIATNVRITNDPFSPPELELRADTARFTRVEPLVDEVVATRPRLVFDQGLEVPTFRNRVTIDRRPREPGLFNLGYDGEDRGGLFIERSFNVFSTPNLQFSVTPQYFIQKAIFDEGVIDPSVFGLRAKLDGTLSPRTTLTGRGVLTSLDPSDFEDQFRASLRLQQIIGTTLPHALNLEYSYRDRLYNGSLGYQTVQSSIGAVLASPVIPLGNTGINLFYQAGAQYINADTDRLDLLKPDRENNRISLGRYQGLVSLSKSFSLWRGEALPPTPTEGLRYTPTPVVPYLSLFTSATGVASVYSNGDTQQSLSGTIGLVGQLGHFSRRYLDYTGFNISYTQVALGNQSPFLFDRVADTKVLSFGITQQVYGPFRIGFQTSINVDTGNEISTDYLLEYSRRTYNILLRYNPVQELGSISLRINDFNWTGNPGFFDEIRPVRQGVRD
ncbi:MAG: DUF3769 domain-containing protein [Cyanobacteriota bacterium]